MNRLPGPSFAVHPARTTHTHNAAVDTHAPRPSPGPPCISAIDETQLKIPSVIAKARGRAQDRARATLMARGPISAATGMAPAEKDQKDQKQRGPARDINPEKKDSSANGREADSKKEEAKAPSAKAERRRRKKKARMLREAEKREREKKGGADDADTDDGFDREVLAAYWAAVASLERRIETLDYFDPPLSFRPGP